MSSTVEKRNEGLIYVSEDSPSVLISGPIKVLAHTYDTNFKKDFGVFLSWVSRVGEHHEKVFKIKDIYFDNGRSTIQLLVDTGLYIHHKPCYWKHIIDYICSAPASETMVTVEQSGWYFKQFVTPSWIAGYNFDKPRVIFQNEFAEQLNSNGTFLEWQKVVAPLCEGNALMIFVLCSVFSAPFLSKLDWDSFLLHINGGSKSGKTTLLKFAASICSDFTYCDSWSSTSNGLEARAKSRNNMIILLDEFQQADPEVILSSIYQLGNGKSKLRATKKAKLQDQCHWSIIGLSTGEISLEQVLAQVNRKVQAGQLMRFFEIPLFQKYGSFDALHGFSSSKEFAEHLAQVTSKQFGTALQPFLTQISSIDNIKEILLSKIKSISSMWLNSFELSRSNQINFAADRFAFLASVGEIAIELGILPWKKNSAKTEIGKVFEAWAANQNEDYNFEERSINNRLRLIIPRWNNLMTEKGEVAKQGWWKLDNDEICWHIHRDAFKKALKIEFDSKVTQAAFYLKSQNWLQSNESARGTFKSSISGRSARNFKIFPERIAKQLELDVNFKHFKNGGAL